MGKKLFSQTISEFHDFGRDINLGWGYNISIQFTGQGGLHTFTGCYEHLMRSSNELRG
jgi:hypothetical protein